MASEARERSRSPHRAVEEEREERRAAATEVEESRLALPNAAAQPAQATASTGMPPVYYSVNFSTWQLVANGRNKYGNLNWNIRSSIYNGTIFNFHALSTERGDSDAWSTQPWEVKAETQDGGPDNKIKLQLEVNERQADWVRGFEDWLVDAIEKQSVDVLNVKQPVKKEMLLSQHFKSILTPATETRPARVKMAFFVSNREKLGVMHYFRLRPDGETWNTEPETLKGWNQIQPAIEGHNLRGAKVRAIVVRTWALSVIRKEIYPSFEIVEMYVKEPKPFRAYGGGLTSEQRSAMLDIE